MSLPASPPFNHRLGFHYWPDTLHYRQEDLETWLPRLTSLGAAWTTLLAPSGRAIPESFVSGLLAAGVRPVLHFAHLTPGAPPPLDDLRPLLSSYARWGVREVAFYERPNLRAAWRPGGWCASDLVERFVDGFLPLAGLAQAEGLAVVFPPLEPGGDYWDLAFLHTALQALQRRAGPALLERLALGAYALAGGRPLNWGAGGPARWPGRRPYQAANPKPEAQEAPGEQDQRGFHIFDWYLAVAEAALGCRLPVLLLRAGYCLPHPTGAPDKSDAPSLADRLRHARLNLAIAATLAPGAAGDPTLPGGLPGPIPAEVQACNFWLLAAEPGQPQAGDAWYVAGQEPQPAAASLRQWVHAQSVPTKGAILKDAPLQGPSTPARGALDDLRWALEDEPALPALEMGPTTAPSAAPAAHRPIQHYVLLPLYAWGASNWDLAAIEPLLQDAHPTIGFSLAEARHAERVTVVGGAGAVSGEALAMLRQSGCQVERISEDGTFIAP